MRGGSLPGAVANFGRLCAAAALGLSLSAAARGPEPMVRIPAGTFRMGAEDGDEDERPPHEVRLGAFELDRTEVTVQAYGACVEAGGCAAPEPTVLWDGLLEAARDFYSEFCNWGAPGRVHHPMNCVSWREARRYCAWSGKRLPTEEEWERAARGPGGRRYPWGDGAPGPRLLNGCGTECVAGMQGVTGCLYRADDGFAASAPVGSYPAGRSAEGALDLAGNVWEWTESRYCPYEQKDCTEPQRVVRGGAWNVASADILRASYRFRSPPSHRFDLVGFRCARSPETPPGSRPRSRIGEGAH